MDIHKERKKKRKKLEKKKSSQSGSTENENRKCNSPTAEGKDEEGVGGNGAVSARRGKYDKHKIGNTKPPEGKDANHGGVAKVKNKEKENGITSQNLSKEEQKNRLLRRLEKQEKNWKFSPGDLKERKLWDNYQTCYEDAINRTSKPHAPWYTIPADDKDTARYMVAKIMYDTLVKYTDIQEPELDDKIKANLDLYKSELNNE